MTGIVIGSSVGIILANQPTRQGAFDLNKGRDIPIPLVDGLSFRILDHSPGTPATPTTTSQSSWMSWSCSADASLFSAHLMAPAPAAKLISSQYKLTVTGRAAFLSPFGTDIP